MTMHRVRERELACHTDAPMRNACLCACIFEVRHTQIKNKRGSYSKEMFSNTNVGHNIIRKTYGRVREVNFVFSGVGRCAVFSALADQGCGAAGTTSAVVVLSSWCAGTTGAVRARHLGALAPRVQSGFCHPGAPAPRV